MSWNNSNRMVLEESRPSSGLYLVSKKSNSSYRTYMVLGVACNVSSIIESPSEGSVEPPGTPQGDVRCKHSKKVICTVKST